MEWDSQPKQAPVHTVERQLTAIHESVIIGSTGFWRLASPDATALRSHFYLRARPLLFLLGSFLARQRVAQTPTCHDLRNACQGLFVGWLAVLMVRAQILGSQCSARVKQCAAEDPRDDKRFIKWVERNVGWPIMWRRGFVSSCCEGF